MIRIRNGANGCETFGTNAQFGKPIAANQGLRWYIADMATRLEASKLLCYQAQIMAELPLDDPFAYTELVCKLMK